MRVNIVVLSILIVNKNKINMCTLLGIGKEWYRPAQIYFHISSASYGFH